MEFNLKKTSIDLSITYNDNNYSNNLSARNGKVIIDDKNKKCYIIIDFSHIYNRKQNKNLNDYEDLMDLLENNRKIKFIQILDDYFASRLLSILHRRKISEENMELIIIIDKEYRYTLNLIQTELGIDLNNLKPKTT